MARTSPAMTGEQPSCRLPAILTLMQRRPALTDQERPRHVPGYVSAYADKPGRGREGAADASQPNRGLLWQPARSDMHLAVRKLTGFRPRPEGRVAEPGKERRHREHHRPAGKRPESRVVDSMQEEIGVLWPGFPLLQFPVGDLQHPGDQQDEEHPIVVPPQPAGQRHAQGDQETRAAEVFAERTGPRRLALRLRRENLGIVVAFELTHARPVDVEEAIPPRLDPEQQPN